MTDDPAIERIKSDITANPVMLYMKGTPAVPQCGFSAFAVRVLDALNVPYGSANVLADPTLRQAIKDYSCWPTLPQLYVKGRFVGGADIMREMYESGELQSLVSDIVVVQA